MFYNPFYLISFLFSVAACFFFVLNYVLCPCDKFIELAMMMVLFALLFGIFGPLVDEGH